MVFYLPLATDNEVLPVTSPVVVSEELPQIEQTKPKADEMGKVKTGPCEENRFHILIVDDDPINRKVLTNHLALRGYRLSEAGDGPEALALLDATTFDLVLLDLMMPRMSGFEVCRRLRKTWSVHELPVIFLTARNQTSDQVTAFVAGASDYLSKPIARDELLSRVHTHLRLLDITRTLEQKVSERTAALDDRNRELTHKNELLESRNRELRFIDDIVKAINREVDLDALTNTMLDAGLALFSCTRGSVFLRDSETGRFMLSAHRGYPDQASIYLLEEELSLEHDRYTTLGRGIIIIHGASQIHSRLAIDEKPVTSLVFSLLVEGELAGFMAVDHMKKSRRLRWRGSR